MLKLSNASFLISALLVAAAFTQTASATIVTDQTLARRGADDGAGDDRGGRGRRGSEGAGHPAIEVIDQLARRGADDGAGDDRGADDGADEGDDHPAIDVIEQLA